IVSCGMRSAAISSAACSLDRHGNKLAGMARHCPQSAASLLIIVLVLFTLCLGAAILLEYSELPGGMRACLLLTFVISLYLSCSKDCLVSEVWRLLYAGS